MVKQKRILPIPPYIKEIQKRITEIKDITADFSYFVEKEIKDRALLKEIDIFEDIILEAENQLYEISKKL